MVSVGSDTDASGGQNVAFWDNKGNQVYYASLAGVWTSLDKLNLVNQSGTAFDPTSVTDLDTWLQKANAQNAAYWLSAQLAATDLDVLSGKVQGGDVVYAANLLAYSSTYNLASQYDLTSDGFITVTNLMNAANAALGNYIANPMANSPYGGSAYRNYLLALAQSLQGVNNNSDFVQLSGSTVAALDCPVCQRADVITTGRDGQPPTDRLGGDAAPDPHAGGAARQRPRRCCTAWAGWARGAATWRIGCTPSASARSRRTRRWRITAWWSPGRSCRSRRWRSGRSRPRRSKGRCSSVRIGPPGMVRFRVSPCRETQRQNRSYVVP